MSEPAPTPIASPLDIARFNLEAFQAVSKYRLDAVKAYADFNYRMMEVAKLQIEVLEKKVKVAKDIEELKQIKRAYKDYERALNKLKVRERELEREQEKMTNAAKNAAMLAWGEWLSPNLVSPAWTGLRAMIEALRGSVMASVQGTSILSEHRLGAHFSKNRTPTADCTSAPGTIKTAVGLFRWAQQQSYIPRQGSPPYELLVSVLVEINDDADEKSTSVAERLADARKELHELRLLHWKQVKVVDVAPKTEAPPE